jgi:hypothetical protein
MFTPCVLKAMTAPPTRSAPSYAAMSPQFVVSNLVSQRVGLPP